MVSALLAKECGGNQQAYDSGDDDGAVKNQGERDRYSKLPTLSAVTAQFTPVYHCPTLFITLHNLACTRTVTETLLTNHYAGQIRLCQSFVETIAFNPLQAETA